MVNFVFGDFISCLNSARRLHAKTIKIRNTKLNLEYLLIFKRMGLIRSFKFLEDNGKQVEVILKYVKHRTVYRNLKLISKPSKRIYIDLIKLSKLKNRSDASIYIISTNKGLKTDLECFLTKLSGELMLKIDL